MSAQPTLQALAFQAREHFGEDGYPFEESIPSSFDVVLAVHLDDSRRGHEVVRARAGAALQDRLGARPGFAPVDQSAVDRFVRDVLAYLRAQFATLEEARRDRLTLSHLFWGNLVEARAVYGPLRFMACACGHIMTGRNDEDLYSLVRRHLWGQDDPERHLPTQLPEAALRRRLVGGRDLVVESVVREVVLQGGPARS